MVESYSFPMSEVKPGVMSTEWRDTLSSKIVGVIMIAIAVYLHRMGAVELSSELLWAGVAVAVGPSVAYTLTRGLVKAKALQAVAAQAQAPQQQPAAPTQPAVPPAPSPSAEGSAP